MDVDKGLEDILLELSEDVKLRLKDSFSKVIIIGKNENYKLFIKFFNKRTGYYYSKRIEYSEVKKDIGKDIYPIFIDPIYDLRTRRGF